MLYPPDRTPRRVNHRDAGEAPAAIARSPSSKAPARGRAGDAGRPTGGPDPAPPAANPDRSDGSPDKLRPDHRPTLFQELESVSATVGLDRPSRRVNGQPGPVGEPVEADGVCPSLPGQQRKHSQRIRVGRPGPRRIAVLRSCLGASAGRLEAYPHGCTRSSATSNQADSAPSRSVACQLERRSAPGTPGRGQPTERTDSGGPPAEPAPPVRHRRRIVDVGRRRSRANRVASRSPRCA